LEASAGYAGAFVLDIEMFGQQLDYTDIEMPDQKLDFTRCTLYLELQPPKLRKPLTSKAQTKSCGKVRGKDLQI
jgi:hypothetical protein